MAGSLNFLVTGAGRGIGRGLTRNLLQRGHNVFLMDNDKDELDHTLSLCPDWASARHKQRYQGRVVDLKDRAAIEASIDSVEQLFDGELNCLVNNAFATPHVWTPPGAVMEDTHIMQQWDDKLAVGLTAPFLLSRLCLPMLTRAVSAGRPSCIINMSSTRAYQAEDDHEAYSACKAGLLGLTRSMAVSLGHRHKVRVNAIVPGWISVDNENQASDRAGTLWEDGMTPADHKFHPAGRVGKVEDIVKAVLFLVDSDFVTGEEIVLDGGVTRKMVYPE